MPTLDFRGKEIEVNEDGYVINVDDWTKELADYIAKMEGIDMTEAHWEVINFLRNFYQKYEVAPMIKILAKEIGKVTGQKNVNATYLYELYPGGPAKQACKIAGLPTSTGCI